MSGRKSTTRGFKPTSQFLQERIRRASETRGFAQSQLLTRWTEIAGADIAAIARPVEVSYGRHSMGATLTVLTTGAQAPMLEMQKDQLRQKVNAIYGYNAISRVRITQTSATGFADGKVQFDMTGAPSAKPAPDAATCEAAEGLAKPVGDDNLRHALEALGRNILTKQKL